MNFQTEREGFKADGFGILRNIKGLRRILDLHKGLGCTSRVSLFPVVSHCGCIRAGQVRDKNWITHGANRQAPWWLAGFPLVASGLSSEKIRRARRSAKSAESYEARRSAILEEIKQILQSEMACLKGVCTTIGAIYARFSSKLQDSIQDQVRELAKEAVRRNIRILIENVFFDIAVSGRKSNRPGLNDLHDSIAKKQFDTLLVFATNRLHRKAYRSLKFVEEQIVERGLRCIFVKNQIDTADSSKWEFTLAMHAAMDEHFAKCFVDNIHAAQLGNMGRGLVYGTLPFGYKGVDTGVVNHRGKPERTIAIDQEAASVVLNIFKSFVNSRESQVRIAQTMNSDPMIPGSPRSTSGDWSARAVRLLLSNERYRGVWRYGVKKTRWLASKDYAVQVPRDNPLGSEIREDLRIVPDDLFFKAQQLLAENESLARGRKPKSPETTRSTRWMSGLFCCAVHECPLHAGGSNGQYSVCPRCQRMPKENRPLVTQLNRPLTSCLLLDSLASLVLLDDDAVQKIVDHFHVEYQRMRLPEANDVESLERRASRLKRDIDLILRNLGESEEDIQQSEQVMTEKRVELAKIRASLAQQQNALVNPPTPPSTDEILKLLANLSQILKDAANERAEENVGDIRNIVDLLTGGQIDLVQMGERRRKRGWLRGTFSVNILKIVADRLPLTLLNTQVSESALQVVIDFKDEIDDSSDVDQVMELFDEGLLYKEIADRLGMNRNRITDLVKKGCAQRGIAVPDGRGRRKRLEKKQRPIPIYRNLADEVHQMWKAGESVEHIARTLNCTGPTVDAAIAFWHSSRGLAVPAGSDRKEGRNERMEQLYREKLEIKAIATALGVSVTTVRLTLRKRLREKGEEFIDGRTRRHQTR